MVEFLRTRTRMQWAVMIGWVMMLSLVVGYDASQGRYVTAATEALAYSFLFIGAAWYAHARAR